MFLSDGMQLKLLFVFEGYFYLQRLSIASRNLKFNLFSERI